MELELSTQTLMWGGAILAAGGLALFMPGSAAQLIAYLNTPDEPTNGKVQPVVPIDRIDGPDGMGPDIPAPKGFAEHVDVILSASHDATAALQLSYLRAALSRDQTLVLQHTQPAEEVKV